MRSLRRFCASILLPAALVVAVLLPAPGARAYVLSGRRWPAGAFPLKWSLDEDGAGGALATSSRDEVARAFGGWRDVSCALVAMRAPETLPAARQSVGAEGENRIYWIESGWTHGSSTLGVTLTTWSAGSDRIFDADIVFNGQDHEWCAGACTGTEAHCRTRCTDVYSIALHEQGHFFGLDHTSAPGAVMRATYPGTPTQQLATDDVNGLCALYPRGTRAVPHGGACWSAADCATGLQCLPPPGGTIAVCARPCSDPSALTCPDGHTCQPAGDGHACFTRGANPAAEGEPCPDGTCALGLLCAPDGGSYVCRRSCNPLTGPWCAAGKACRALAGRTDLGACHEGPALEGEMCEEVACAAGLSCAAWGTRKRCWRPCTVSQPVCASGETCTVSGGDAVCVPGGAGGARAQGEACATTPECVAGLFCLDVGGGDKRCVSACAPSAPVCAGGLRCNGTGGAPAGYCWGVAGKGGDGEACTSSAQCESGLVCLRESASSIVCRIDCSARECPDARECRSFGAARVCLEPEGSGGDGGCACSGGGAGLLAAVALFGLRRRKAARPA